MLDGSRYKRRCYKAASPSGKNVTRFMNTWVKSNRLMKYTPIGMDVNGKTMIVMEYKVKSKAPPSPYAYIGKRGTD